MSDRDSQQQTAHRTDCRSPRWPRVMLVALAGPLARRLFRLHVEGDQHVPASGPAIIAANHQSFLDHVALMLSVGRPLSFVGKIDYLNSWKSWHLLPALGMIPVDRGVCTTSALIPVCTPFSGQLVTMSAVAGERVGRCQRVVWLRTRT